MCNHLISCGCYAGVNLPLKKSLFQVFFDVLGFEAVYEGVDSSRKETVHHYDDNANRNTESESQIIGQVHEASWHVIQTRDEKLRRAGGQSLHAALRAGHSQNSDDDDKVGKDDETQRHQQAEHGKTERNYLNSSNILASERCYCYMVTVALYNNVRITIGERERV